MTDTDTDPLQVVWPDAIGGYAVDSDRGLLGVLVVQANEDELNLAFTPAQVRQLAAFWFNLSDELDKVDRKA